MPKRKTALYVALIAMLAAIPAVTFAQDANGTRGEELGSATGDDDTTRTTDDEEVPGDEPTEGTATTQPSSGSGDGGGGGLFGQWQFPLILLAVLVLMYIFTTRTRRKQEKQRREMLESLSKGDKVVTIGGIVGTVIEIKGNEVTVKVDENNNVRMKFTRWAVRNVGDEAKNEDPTQQ